MNILLEIMLAKADPTQVAGLSRFFKTGPGQYGEGDQFLGIKVPVTRDVVKECWRETDMEQLEECIRSEYHEVRLAALLALVEVFRHAGKMPQPGPGATISLERSAENAAKGQPQTTVVQMQSGTTISLEQPAKNAAEGQPQTTVVQMQSGTTISLEQPAKNAAKGQPQTTVVQMQSGTTISLEQPALKASQRHEMTREECVRFYLSHTDRINNWDLVDLSCYPLLGEWLLDKERSLLYEMARSGKTIWEQRIGMVSTMTFVRHGQLTDTFDIADILLHHPHDLIHKAVGWLLREAGKKDKAALETFLGPRYKSMPRTMLRYAIEKFPEDERQHYLAR